MVTAGTPGQVERCGCVLKDDRVLRPKTARQRNWIFERSISSGPRAQNCSELKNAAQPRFATRMFRSFFAIGRYFPFAFGPSLEFVSLSMSRATRESSSATFDIDDRLLLGRSRAATRCSTSRWRSQTIHKISAKPKTKNRTVRISRIIPSPDAMCLSPLDHSTSRITRRRFTRSSARITSFRSSTARRRSTVRFASRGPGSTYSPRMRLASSTARIRISWSGLFIAATHG
jgi:hypothetical protein